MFIRMKEKAANEYEGKEKPHRIAHYNDNIAL